MIRLSAVIITHNEEQNIADCIDSLSGVADEIVVVDSFSTDKTESICNSKGVQFLQHKFDGHIEQKNFAMLQANNDFVLSLDADERLSEELKQSIRGVKENWKHDGYTMNRLNNYCGQWIKHCGWYPDRKLRLWNRTKGKWGGENPHDKVIMQNGTTTSFLKGDLLHFTVRTIEQHKQQVEKFTTISAEALYRKGKYSNKLFAIIGGVFSFLNAYFLNLGFLDGYYGWKICFQSGRYNYLKYSKLALLIKNRK